MLAIYIIPNKIHIQKIAFKWDQVLAWDLQNPNKKNPTYVSFLKISPRTVWAMELPQWKVCSFLFLGWRNFMEDSHIAILNFGGNSDIDLFGVFDGHGGT